MNKMTEKSFLFLKNYLNNFSPSGYEMSEQKIWLEHIKEYVDKTITDTYGTAVGIINPDAKYKVVVEAHADEVSWVVSYITKDGFIYLKKNGGVDEQISISKRVVIMTDDGLVKGVLGWPATHIRPKDKKPEVTSVYVDCGAKSKKDVLDRGIQIGNPVLFDEGFSLMGNSFVGRGLDNRIGGFVIAEVARMMKELGSVDFGVYFVNAVQEEVGQKGAQMIAKTIKPNVAIVTDVCHDTNTPMITKSSYGDLSIGDGPVISYSPSVHNNLNKLIIDASKKNDIPLQRKACTNKTGTDADAIAYSGKGVATALISLPMRYMHTSVETVSAEDVSNTANLIYKTLISIKDGEDFKYSI